MNIEIHGTGRAAGSLAIAANEAGHTVVGIHGRNPQAVSALERLVPVSAGSAELRLIAVSDSAIAEVAAHLAGTESVATVHVSGAMPVSTLAAIGEGVPIGSFHPLQTMPDPMTGAARLPGAWVAVTADEPLASVLVDFAESLGCRPFALSDDVKPLYHAAAAAWANVPLAAFGVAERLFEEAGVPREAAHPLVDAIVANAFSMGPRAALTGPVARGDVDTVRRQMLAVREAAPDVSESFRSLVHGTASFAGNAAIIGEAIE